MDERRLTTNRTANTCMLISIHIWYEECFCSVAATFSDTWTKKILFEAALAGFCECLLSQDKWRLHHFGTQVKRGSMRGKIPPGFFEEGQGRFIYKEGGGCSILGCEMVIPSMERRMATWWGNREGQTPGVTGEMYLFFFRTTLQHASTRDQWFLFLTVASNWLITLSLV